LPGVRSERKDLVVGSLSAADLVGTPIRLHGILLGRPVDIVLDPGFRRALGFVVESGDEAPRFLPFAASQPGEGVIAVASALMLLDDVAFYRTRGASFRALVGTQIEHAGVPVGSLVDLHIGHTGDVVEIEVERDGARDRVAAAGSSFAAAAATAA
jgi:hypothetical protein